MSDQVPKPEGDAAPSSAKKAYQRSPGYPGINLEAALARAERLYQKETKNWAHIDVVLSDIGYNTPTGDALRTIAALEKYGLIEDKGKGDQRQARLTPRALEIILGEKESAEYADAVWDAALAPSVFMKVWNHFEGSLPSDQALNRYLILDGFTKLGATTFIKVFRSTLAFADRFNGGKLSPSDGPPAAPESSPSGGKLVIGGGHYDMSTVRVAQAAPAANLPASLGGIRIPIAAEEFVEILGLHPMPKGQWEKFKKRLKATLEMYEEDWAIDQLQEAQPEMPQDEQD